MTQAQVVEIAALVFLRYPQAASLAEAEAATRDLMVEVTRHPDYDFERDHIGVWYDHTTGSLDVRFFASADELREDANQHISHWQQRTKGRHS